MMKTLLLSLTLLFISLVSVAQHYAISPARTVNMTPAFNELTIVDIYQENTSNTTIQLKWKLLSNGLFPGWDFSLCDYTTCYPGIPDSGTMTPVPPGEKGFLGLNVKPYDIPGTGMVKMYVYEEGFETKGDTLTWLVIAKPTGITEFSRSAVVSLYPNPANEMVTVHVDAADLSSASIQVTDLLGKSLINKPVINESTKLDVSGLPTGYYLIQCKYGNETAGMKKLCIAK
jgi:hypothetical protein